MLRLNVNVRDFYMQFSVKNVDAAAKAQEGSWKEVTLTICRSLQVQQSFIPADFDEQFFTQLEEEGFADKRMVKLMNPDQGNYIAIWSEHCRGSILKAMYSQIDSSARSTVMPKNQPIDTYDTFKKTVMRSQDSRTNSSWTFPKIIPTPKPIHTLLYLLFLIGPAAAVDQEENIALDNLKAVIYSQGVGIKRTHVQCYGCCDILYEQSVSETV
jgi:hypothetical protein